MNLPTKAAVGGTVFIGSLSFSMSFTALTELAAANGVHTPWMLPLVLDGGVIVSTAAAFALVSRRWFGFMLLLSSSALSVAGNVAHAQHTLTAQVMAAIPALWLLAATHLTVMLVRQSTFNLKPIRLNEPVLGSSLVAA